MKVKELIELLKECNPEANVVVSKEVQIGDYTWDTEHVETDGIMAWPEPKEKAESVEITQA